MISIFGFYTYKGYANNHPKTTAKFGEFSQHSATFSREIGIYTNTAYARTTLLVLNAENEAGEAQTLNDDTAGRILQVGQWLLEKAASGEIQEDRDQVISYLKDDFTTYLDSIDIPTPTTDGTVYLPAWISFKITATGDVVKIWLSDSVFQSQYPKYEYEVVPPVPKDQLDTFFEDLATLKKLVDSRSSEKLTEEINEVRDQFPDTQLWTKTYKAYDYTDDSKYINTDWTVIIYGAAGNNIDNIKEFLQNWILSNSTHGRPDWEIVLPDLFIPTEHIFIPIWNRHSAPEMTNQARIYSPIFDDSLMDTYLKNFADGYGAVAEVRKSLQAVPTLWRSIGFLSVGNSRNRDGKLKFYDRWPQYALISTTSIDINRIDDATREFITFTYEMLKLAESLTEDDPVPLGYSRVTRGSNSFLAKSHNDVQYLFLTKEAFLKKMPDEADTPVGG